MSCSMSMAPVCRVSDIPVDLYYVPWGFVGVVTALQDLNDAGVHTVHTGPRVEADRVLFVSHVSHYCVTRTGSKVIMG